MKNLKFKNQLCEQIISGHKTSTWRLFDDKDLQISDELQFINKDTGEIFGFATITSLSAKTFNTLEDKDWESHERYSSDEEMYKTFRSYYGNNVNENTEVKIISFVFRPLLKEFNSESVTFIESSMVKEGVVCDVYRFNDDDQKDLGIVRVQSGYKTPLQKVLKGDRTLEIFMEGQGILKIIDINGDEKIFNFPSDEKGIEVAIGDSMQWEAIKDLTFAEICYPPYEEGRFENISN